MKEIGTNKLTNGKHEEQQQKQLQKQQVESVFPFAP